VSTNARAPIGSVEEMRRRFDAVFAAPPAPRAAAITSFLGLRIGGDGFVLRIQALSGLAAARTIVPLPGAAPAMLGLAGIRGLVVPVFSLSALMGYGSQPPRWFALCAGQGGDTIAFSFSDFDGYLEALVSDVRADDSIEPREHRSVRRPSSSRELVREVVRAQGELRGVIDLSLLVKAAYETVPAAGLMKER